MSATRVNTYVSDLFFNTDHHSSLDSKGVFFEHDELAEEAKAFLFCMAGLGVDIPSVDDLVEDFRNRL